MTTTGKIAHVKAAAHQARAIVETLRAAMQGASAVEARAMLANIEPAAAMAAALFTLASDMEADQRAPAAGRCPNFDRGTDAPDSYRAEDLED